LHALQGRFLVAQSARTYGLIDNKNLLAGDIQ